MKFCAIFLLSIVSAAQAQTVFKCTGADGSPIFSQSPCGANAQELNVKVIAPPVEQLQGAAEQSKVKNAARKIERQELECIRRAENAAYSNADRRVRGYNARIVALERRISTAANNFAGATWEAGMREEIAALHQAIATERASADNIVAMAYDRCADERSKRESALSETE